METTKVKRASFSLEDEYHDLFRQIAKKTRRSMTDELRMMIDARAMSVGLKPLNEVDPKSLASSLVMAQ
jgi:hypothetical protein